MDILLPLGAAAFYLYDSALPLYGNEVLLTRSRGAWKARGPSRLVLMGRRIAWLPPLLPNQAAFRAAVASQHILSARSAGADDPQPFLAATRGLGAIVLVLLALLLFALPVSSIILRADIIVLGVFAAYYLTLLAGLALVFRRRKALGVPGRAFAALAFDVLLCPPFGVNLLRKLSLRRGLNGNPVSFARRNLDAEALENLRVLLLNGEIEASRGRPVEQGAVESPYLTALRNPEHWR